MDRTRERAAPERSRPIGRPVLSRNGVEHSANAPGGQRQTPIVTPAPGRPTVVASLVKNSRERLRISLERYQGMDLIDLRVTVELTASSGIQTPTKKGVSLRVELLPDFIEALNQAQTMVGGGLR